MIKSISVPFKLLLALSFILTLVASFTMTEKNVDFNGKSSFDEIKINRQVLSVQKRVESEGNYEEQMGLINSINANTYLENTTIYDK